MMKWLNDNAGAVQAIATIVLVVVTAWYVIHTRRMARKATDSARAADELVAESRLARMAQFEPLLIPTRVRYHPYRAQSLAGVPEVTEHLEVEVTNVGPSPAYSIGLCCPCLMPGPFRVTSRASAPELYDGKPLLRDESRTLSLGLALPRTPLDIGPTSRVGDLRIEYVNIFGRQQTVEAEYTVEIRPGSTDFVECPMVGPPVVRGHLLDDRGR